ncbi:hypothetical protein AMECASPLE_000486, partial [Ameca splendens]
SCGVAAACHGLLISSWKMGIGRGAQSGCGQLSHTLTHKHTKKQVRFLPDLSQSSVVVLAISWNWTEPGKRGFFPVMGD